MTGDYINVSEIRKFYTEKIGGRREAAVRELETNPRLSENIKEDFRYKIGFTAGLQWAIEFINPKKEEVDK